VAAIVGVRLVIAIKESVLFIVLVDSLIIKLIKIYQVGIKA